MSPDLPQTHRLGMHLLSLHWKLSGVQLRDKKDELGERMSERKERKKNNKTTVSGAGQRSWPAGGRVHFFAVSLSPRTSSQ